MSNPALWATSTELPANSKNIGSTASMVGASQTIADVMPVSCTICGGMLRCGSTRVANSPSTAPPRTLTAPISVMASAGVLFAVPVARPPVVSRSTTTNVVWRNDSSSGGIRQLGETQLIRAGHTHGGDVKHPHRQPRLSHAERLVVGARG